MLKKRRRKRKREKERKKKKQFMSQRVGGTEYETEKRNGEKS
mgnify:CR=1 FL=1